MSITVGSLCSGYEGVSLGLAAAGIEHRLVFVADSDKAASAILAARHPNVPNLGDIKAVDWSDVEVPDLLTMGFPCQDVSSAGLRRGIAEGTRSGLWLECAWAINNLRPRWVLIENVRGLLSARADCDVEPCAWCLGDRGGNDGEPVLRALGAVLGDLADLGYDAVWATVPASDAGAAHQRQRVFIVAHPADAEGFGHGDAWAPLLAGVPAAAVGGAAAAGGVSLLPTPVAHDDGKSPDAHLAMKARMPGGERTQITSLSVLARADFDQPLLPTPRTSDANGAGSHGNGGPDLRTAVTALLPTPDATHGRKTTRTGPLLAGAVELLPTLRASDGTHGGPNQRGSKGDLMLPSAVHQFGPYGVAVEHWAQVIGRPWPNPTEPGAEGKPRLAPRFVEWLMGLPEGWVTNVPGISRNDMLRALGNGIVPQQLAHALRLLAASAPVRVHRERPNYGAEGTVCAACHDWWPCETVAPRTDDDTPALFAASS